MVFCACIIAFLVAKVDQLVPLDVTVLAIVAKGFAVVLCDDLLNLSLSALFCSGALVTVSEEWVLVFEDKFATLFLVTKL